MSTTKTTQTKKTPKQIANPKASTPRDRGTDRPWYLDHPGFIVDGTGHKIADTKSNVPRHPEESDANAELIVRAVNSHDDLLAACEAVYKSLTQPGAKGNPSAAVMLKQLHAAIAKARNA